MKSSTRVSQPAPFNLAAARYDAHRRQLIPCFDDFYGALMAVAQTPSPAPKILDLGAGTGLVSERLKQKYPKASFVLVDAAESMLDLAVKKLGASAACVVGDYTRLPELGTFDLVVSALSIHHLASREKRRLIERVFAMLKPGGSFVNADQVLGPTPAWEKLFKQTWKARIEASGLPPAYRKLAYRRMALDREDTLERHLDWMRQAGFTGVACVYQWFPFAVMAGKKRIRGAQRETSA